MSWDGSGELQTMTKHLSIRAAADGHSRAWIARSIIGAALIFVVIVRLAGRLDDPPFPLDDPAIRYLLVLISGGVAMLTGVIWFCFRSSYSLRLRLGAAVFAAIGVLTVAGVIAGLRFTRRLEFSGSLAPRLTPGEQDLGALPIDTLGRKTDFAAITADDFPQFLGPDRRGWISEPPLARNWQSQPPRQLWRRPVGAGWSAFAAANGFAVTMEQRGNQECVVCYEIATGRPNWMHAIVARHESTLGGIGPRSTPTIHDGRVYALGATGVLRCLDGSGQLLWKDDLRKRYGLSDSDDEEQVMFGRAASPLIVDSLVVVPGGGPPGKAKSLVAFDRKSGQLVWEAENKLPTGLYDQIGYASPALATLGGCRQIVIVNESTASGHDSASGQCLWSHPWPGRSNGNASVSQAVAVGDSRVLLSKGYGGGAELIELTAGSGGELSVTSLWKVPRVLQTKFSNVVIHRDHAFALSEGILECVDLQNGRRRWKNGRFGHGQILGVGELALVLSEEGELNLVELNPEKFVQHASFMALRGKTWNNLCLYGGQLLIRNAEEAACFELP